MSDAPFDPYHKWLGIPPKDQPPDHYRLLGIERFETDPDVIGFAADARMAHVRSLAVGPHSQVSQQLLNAISAARVCLLNPQAKGEYDQVLRHQIGLHAAAPEELPAPLPAKRPVPPPPVCRQHATPPPVWRAVVQQRLLTKQTLALAGTTAGVLLLFVVVWLAAGGRRPVAQSDPPPGSPDVEAEAAPAWAEPAPPESPGPESPGLDSPAPGPPADSVAADQASRPPSDEVSDPAAGGEMEQQPRAAGEPPPDAPAPAPGPPPPQPSTTEETPAEEKPATTEQETPAEEKPATTEQETPAEEKPATTEQETPAEMEPATTEQEPPAEQKPATTEQETPAEMEPATTEQEPPAEQKPATTEQESPAAEPESEPKPPAAEETPAEETSAAGDAMLADGRLPEEPPSGQGKRPVPSGEELAELQKQLDDFYKPHQVASLGERRELAERLLHAAFQPPKRSSAQYALMRNAWELWAKTGNVDRAMEIVNQIAELYAIDPLQTKVDVVKTAERSARGESETEEALVQLLEHTDSLIATLLEEDRYDSAVELAEQVGIPLAGRIDDGRQVADWIERRDAFRHLQEEYAPVGKARELLQTDPSDAAANLTVGRWLCLAKNQWPKGLPYLALGGDEPLARLAARDLEGPFNAEQQIDLADAWWTLSQQAEFRRNPPVAASLQARATLWYHEALPSVSGALRERAEERLGMSGSAEPGGGKPALAFDGRQSHAVVNFGYAGTCPITLEVIARAEHMEGAGSVVSNYDPARRSGLTLGTMGGVSWFFTFVEAAPHPRQATLTIGTPIRAVARPARGASGWCHVAAVFDGKEIRLYVDGKLQDTKAIGGPHRPTTKMPLVLGASPARVAASGLLVDSHYKGMLKAVRISDVARYTDDFPPPAQLAREDNHTQLLLRFDEQTGDTVPDISGGKAAPAGARRTPAPVARLLGTRWVDDRIE